MKAYLRKQAAAGGSSLISYSMAPSDALLKQSQSMFVDSGGLSKMLRKADGAFSMNDEMYRNTTASMKAVPGTSPTEYRKALSLARSIATKKDQEATIRLIANTKAFSQTGAKPGGSTPLKNIIPPYTKFFLESVSEDRAEKAQIVETFGSFIAFFFGARPEVYQFGGRLLNAQNHDWKNDFQEAYEYFLRGTKCVAHDATVMMQYDDVLVQGFLMNCHLEYHAITNNQCPFSFSMLVTARSPVNQLQRLKDRAARSAISKAEAELLASLQGIQKSRPNSFAIMQGLLSSESPITTSDIVLYGHEKNKVTQSGTKTSTVGSGNSSPSEWEPNSSASANPWAPRTST